MDGVEITGLRELVRDLERYGAEVGDLKTEFTKIGDIVATEARSTITVRTGASAASIRPAKAKNKAAVRAGGAKAPAVKFLNYGRYWPTTGTRFKGTRFLNNAANDKRPEILAAMREGLDRIARKVGLS